MGPSTDQPDHGDPMQGDDGARLVATVSERDDGPDQCTIFPVTVSNRDERRSAWITAEGDAFVETASVR